MGISSANSDDSDEIRREDGGERYWFDYTGELAATIGGLCAVIGVFSCFPVIPGYGQTIVGCTLAIFAVLRLVAWRLTYGGRDETACNKGA